MPKSREGHGGLRREIQEIFPNFPPILLGPFQSRKCPKPWQEQHHTIPENLPGTSESSGELLPKNNLDGHNLLEFLKIAPNRPQPQIFLQTLRA